MAAALRGPRPGRVARPIPSAPSFPRPNARPYGTGGVGRARCPSRLGRAQTPRAPWGSDQTHPHTPLTAWLIRLGIQVSHARPYHPQTQGKDERFHRTLVAEVLRYQIFRDVAHCQTHLHRWRDVYNLQRPHQALQMAVPASRYQPSPRPYPDVLSPIEYGPEDIVRKVQAEGLISYQNRTFRLSKAFRALPVALRPTSEDRILDVFFCHQKVARVDLHQPHG